MSAGQIQLIAQRNLAYTPVGPRDVRMEDDGSVVRRRVELGGRRSPGRQKETERERGRESVGNRVGGGSSEWQTDSYWRPSPRRGKWSASAPVLSQPISHAEQLPLPRHPRPLPTPTDTIPLQFRPVTHLLLYWAFTVLASGVSKLVVGAQMNARVHLLRATSGLEDI